MFLTTEVAVAPSPSKDEKNPDYPM